MRGAKQTNQEEIGRIKFTDTRDIVASLIGDDKSSPRTWVNNDSYKR